MKITKFGLGTLLLALSACASDSTQLRDTRDRSADEQARDQAACMAHGSDPDLNITLKGQARAQARYVNCMESRGYKHEYADN